MLPQVTATRYVTPLKEGGSLPGIVEASDDGTYVMKFRGAGQGLKVLVAEIIVAGLARAIDVPVPDLAVITLDERIAKYEADEEVQDLLTASVGTNLGVDFLPGSLGYDGSSHRPRTLLSASSGWTLSPPMSTARGPTPTSSCGTGRRTPSTTAPPSTSTTRGRAARRRPSDSRLRRSTQVGTSCETSRAMSRRVTTSSLPWSRPSASTLH